MSLIEQTVATERLLAVEQAIDAFAEGGFVIVYDDDKTAQHSGERKGDLLLAAEHTHEGALQQLLDHTSGLVRVAMPDERAETLRLPHMVAENTGLHDTAFTVSVDLIEGCTSGISARERSRTIRALADPATAPEHLGRPGHVFPVRAVPGGVLEREGHTEAAVDLSQLAGLSGVTALCEIVGPDWNMARFDDLSRLAARRLMPLISVCDLTAYRVAKQAHEG